MYTFGSARADSSPCAVEDLGSKMAASEDEWFHAESFVSLP